MKKTHTERVRPGTQKPCTWYIFIDQCSLLEEQLYTIKSLAEIAKKAGAGVSIKIGETHHGYREKTNFSSPHVPLNAYRGRRSNNNNFARFSRANKELVEFFETSLCHGFRDHLYVLLSEVISPLITGMQRRASGYMGVREKLKLSDDTKLGGKELEVMEESLRTAVYEARKHLGSLKHKNKEEITFKDLQQVFSKRSPKTIQILRNASLVWGGLIKPRLTKVRKNRGEDSVFEQITKFSDDSNTFVTFLNDDGPSLERFVTRVGDRRLIFDVPVQCVTAKKFTEMVAKIVSRLAPLQESSASEEYKELERNAAALKIRSDAAKSRDPRVEKFPRTFDPVKTYVDLVAKALGVSLSRGRS